jgi:hypothetical protein
MASGGVGGAGAPPPPPLPRAPRALALSPREAERDALYSRAGASSASGVAATSPHVMIGVIVTPAWMSGVATRS